MTYRLKVVAALLAGAFTVGSACSSDGADTSPTTVASSIEPPVSTTSPAPATTIADVPTTSPATLAPLPPPSWAFDDFMEVPRLGPDPVRGTGCQFQGDVIPDGWWFGVIRGSDSTSIDFDIACAYFGDVVQQHLDDRCIISGDDPVTCDDFFGPTFWPVNKTERTFHMPFSDDMLVEPDPGFCEAEDMVDFELEETVSWMNVERGEVRYVRNACYFLIS